MKSIFRVFCIFCSVIFALLNTPVTGENSTNLERHKRQITNYVRCGAQADCLKYDMKCCPSISLCWRSTDKCPDNKNCKTNKDCAKWDMICCDLEFVCERHIDDCPIEKKKSSSNKKKG